MAVAESRRPPWRRRWSCSRQYEQRRSPVCRSFSSERAWSSASNTLQAVSRDVARARVCPPVPKCTSRTREASESRQRRQHLSLFAGLLCKPSDGLEPSTPSLPSWGAGGRRGHGRVLAATKTPQTEGFRRGAMTRAWTRVYKLVFASRSHRLYAVRATPLGCCMSAEHTGSTRVAAATGRRAQPERPRGRARRPRPLECPPDRTSPPTQRCRRPRPRRGP
jgi:hypothetical protein